MRDRDGDEGTVRPARRRRRAPRAEPGGRATSGRRRARRRRDRRRRVLRGLAGTAAVVVAVAGVAWGMALLVDGEDEGSASPATSPTPAPEPADGDPQTTLVVATHDETGAAGADVVVLLAATPARGTGTIVLVPPNVVADVPGQGLARLGATYRQGQAPLLELTLSNLLGVDLDAAAAISAQGWAALVARMDGLTLDVPEELVAEVDGTRTTRFRAGTQPLDGARVAEYLTFREPGESELQRLPRVQQVWQAMLDRIAEDPAVLDEVFADGAPMIDGPDPGLVRSLLRSLADARAAGNLEVRTLPVAAMGTGEEATFRIDEDRVAELVDEHLAPSVPAGAGESGRRLQVLNGNGAPGVGSRVADLLQPAGFRLVETGNAANFDVPRTRIIVYEDSPQQLAVAREAQQRLGVGEVEVSEVPVSVVDVTVIVGGDFPPP